MSRSQDRPLGDFIDFAERVVGTINEALENVPRDRVRIHACWGNYEAPHDCDVDLHDILPAISKAKVGGWVLPFANPRHAHEYRCVKDLPLGDGAGDRCRRNRSAGPTSWSIRRWWLTGWSGLSRWSGRPNPGFWPGQIADSIPRPGAAGWPRMSYGPSSGQCRTAHGSRRSVSGCGVRACGEISAASVARSPEPPWWAKARHPTSFGRQTQAVDPGPSPGMKGENLRLG